MPLREYECQACHRRIEKIKSFSAPPETICPHCGGELRETLSAPAIQFKGSGWYVSDYAKSGATKKRSDDSAGKSGANEGSAKEGSAADVSASADTSNQEKTGASNNGEPAAASASTKNESAATPAGGSAKTSV